MSLTDIDTALELNADYAETGSVTKAKAYATALRRKIAIFPSEAVHGGRGQGESVRYTMEVLKALLDDVTKWISGNDTTSTTAAPRVKYPDLRGGYG